MSFNGKRAVALIAWKGNFDSKTRLAQDLGDKAAREIAGHLLNQNISVCKDISHFQELYLLSSGTWNPTLHSVKTLFDDNNGLNDAVQNALIKLYSQFDIPIFVVIMADLIDFDNSCFIQMYQHFVNQSLDFLIIPASDGGTAILFIRNGVYPYTVYGENSSEKTHNKLTEKNYKGEIFPFSLKDMDRVSDYLSSELFPNFLNGRDKRSIPS